MMENYNDDVDLEMLLFVCIFLLGDYCGKFYDNLRIILFSEESW